MKQVTFCNILIKNVTYINRNFVYNLQTFRGVCQVYFDDFLANSASKQGKAEVRLFLGICLYDCFIYRSNFVLRKCLKTRCHLDYGRKTVNSQGYSELREPIKTRENYDSLIW